MGSLELKRVNAIQNGAKNGVRDIRVNNDSLPAEHVRAEAWVKAINGSLFTFTWHIPLFWEKKRFLFVLHAML